MRQLTSIDAIETALRRGNVNIDTIAGVDVLPNTVLVAEAAQERWAEHVAQGVQRGSLNLDDATTESKLRILNDGVLLVYLLRKNSRRTAASALFGPDIWAPRYQS